MLCADEYLLSAPAIAEDDAIAEIVGDDAVAIAVETHVGGQHQRVAPAHDALLGAARLAPLQHGGLHCRFDPTYIGSFLRVDSSTYSMKSTSAYIFNSKLL